MLWNEYTPPVATRAISQTRQSKVRFVKIYFNCKYKDTAELLKENLFHLHPVDPGVHCELQLLHQQPCPVGLNGAVVGPAHVSQLLGPLVAWLAPSTWCLLGENEFGTEGWIVGESLVSCSMQLDTFCC